MTPDEILAEAELLWAELRSDNRFDASQHLPTLLTDVLEDLLARKALGIWQKQALWLAIDGTRRGWYSVATYEIFECYVPEREISPRAQAPEALEQVTPEALIREIAELPNAPLEKLGAMLGDLGQK